MAMRIQHNMASANANRNLGVTSTSLQKSTEKLSSGYRINRAGDDAAGLAISEKMRGQIRGLNQASSNSDDAISLVQTAEGALQETQNIVQRMRELAVQAATDTNTATDRTQIQTELDQLTQEVDRIATTSEFNTKKLLDGSLTGNKTYQAGNATVAGTFANSNVSVKDIKTSDANLVRRTDTIRIEFQHNISTAGNITLASKVSTAAGAAGNPPMGATLTTLNGISAANAANAAGGAGGITVATGADGVMTITITKALYANADAKDSAAGSVDLKIQISSAFNIKAGDVITIDLAKMTGTSAVKNAHEGLKFQVGANSGQEVKLNIASMKAKDLGITRLSTTADTDGSAVGATIGKALDVTSQAKASLAIDAYDKALNTISKQRANLGAVQNRLEHTIANLDTSSENLQSAESRIRDVDMATEMTNYSKNNILTQAGQSMLAQANQSTQGVLSLLQ